MPRVRFRVSASWMDQVIEVDYWKRTSIIGIVIGFLGILYLLYHELTAKKWKTCWRLGVIEALQKTSSCIVS
uniref:Ovule protein n=1 Tax=Strongyloides venezuelensis TaxID=75913 RepID=A0A0K0F524_STRVS